MTVTADKCCQFDAVRTQLTGKERDSESGLDNFGARYDSSSLGRFMSPDWSAAPMGDEAADKMVDSAKEKGKEQPDQPNQPGQPNPNQQPSTSPNIPPPPPPVPPPPPPCALEKEKKC